MLLRRRCLWWLGFSGGLTRQRRRRQWRRLLRRRLLRRLRRLLRRLLRRRLLRRGRRLLVPRFLVRRRLIRRWLEGRGAGSCRRRLARGRLLARGGRLPRCRYWARGGHGSAGTSVRIHSTIVIRAAPEPCGLQRRDTRPTAQVLRAQRHCLDGSRLGQSRHGRAAHPPRGRIDPHLASRTQEGDHAHGRTGSR